MNGWKWWPTMPALLFVGMVGPGLLGATAQADPDIDGKFLAAITERGFTFPEASDAISAAAEVCDYLDQGYSQYATGIVVAAITGFDITTSLLFVGESVTAYCPEHTIGVLV